MMQKDYCRNTLILMGSFDVGGLETYVVNVLENLDRRRFSPVILYEGRGNDAYLPRIRELDVPVYKKRFTPYIVPFLRRLGQIISQHHIDIVCDFRGDFAGPTLWYAKQIGVKSRLAMYRNAARNYRATIFNRTAAHFFHQQILRHATCITGNTSGVLDFYFPERPNWRSDPQFAVLHNGVKLERFCMSRNQSTLRSELHLDDNVFLIGHLGRFTYEKNHPAILQVFQRIHRQNADVQLVLIGDGPKRGDFEATAKTLGISDRIHLLGTRRDVPQLLAGLDAFLFPSISEGMPNALVEAMAAGLPFVASNIKQITEIVPTALDTQLTAPDDIDAMTIKLCALIQDTTKAARIGIEARDWVHQHYAIEKSVEKLCELWTGPLTEEID